MTETAAPAPTADEDFVAERWRYAGRRADAKGKISHAWQTDPAETDPDEVKTWQKLPAHIVGGVYLLRVARTEGGRLWVRGDASWAESGPDDDLRTAWAARDSIARTREAAARAERAAGRRDAVDEALEPLLSIARGLRTGAEKDAFTATVLRRLNAAW